MGHPGMGWITCFPLAGQFQWETLQELSRRLGLHLDIQPVSSHRSVFHIVLPSIHPTDFSLLWAALGVDAPWVSPVSLPAFQPGLRLVTRAPACHLSRSLCMPVWRRSDLPDNRTGTWDSIFSAQPNQLPLTHLLPMSKIMLLFPLLLVFVLVDFCREKPLYCCNGVWEGNAGKCRHSICLPTPRLP